MMTLPLYFAPSMGEIAVAKEGMCSTIESTSLYLLIVDDSVSNRKFLGRLLTRSGHVCDLAEDGAQALEMEIKKRRECEPYDCILLDYEMPVVNGPNAAKEMRRTGSDVLIVGITGNVLPEDVTYFISCGANAVLPKPLKLADLDDLWSKHGVLERTTESSIEPSIPS